MKELKLSCEEDTEAKSKVHWNNWDSLWYSLNGSPQDINNHIQTIESEWLSRLVGPVFVVNRDNSSLCGLLQLLSLWR
jgi:hypothetical protein